MTVNRRTVVRSAAWTAPAVAVATAAPAFATSPARLNFTYTVVAHQGPDMAGSCDDLTITIDNSASNVDLTMTKNVTQAQIIGWNAVNTVNETNVIPAGAVVVTYASQNTSTAVPALNLRWIITINDAGGVSRELTSSTLRGQQCGSTATITHSSTA